MISNVSNHTVVTLMSRGLAVLHSEDTSDYTGEYCISTVVFSTLMGQQKRAISLELLDMCVHACVCRPLLILDDDVSKIVASLSLKECDIS